MEFVFVVLLAGALIALTVAQLGGSVAALFFGRKLPWLWFALAVMVVTIKITSVAFYRETDGVRGIASLTAGFVAAGVGLLLQKRFPSAVLVVGGFLAAGLTIIQALGPLLNPAPQWLVVAVLVACGIAGAIWTRTNPAPATIVLSAFIGAGVLADIVVDAMQIDETLRFQVYAVLALLGIGFQFWMERRGQRTRARHAQGTAA